MKILVGTNTLSTVDQQIYANHCQFWYRLGKELPEVEFLFLAPPRMTIDSMRNLAAKIAMQNEVDYILFIDDDILVPTYTLDNGLPVNWLQTLINADYDILAAHTVIRGYPYNNMAFEWIDEAKTHMRHYNEFVPNSNGIVDCGAVGFSCCLLKVSMLRKMAPPFFITGAAHTEDVYFCIKAQRTPGLEDVKIGFHTGLTVGHLGDRKIYVPTEIVPYKTLDETLNPDLLKKEDDDRGDKYLSDIGYLSARGIK